MPRLVPRKMLGEQAECVFQAEAMGRGFFVSKPYGDSAPYDFIVQRRAVSHQPSAIGKKRKGGRGARLWRVQVKSVTARDSQSRYTVNTRRSFSRAYLPGELDFFACWIVPLDLWYIIPAGSIVPHKCVHLYPHIANSRGKHEKYREAWHLLG